MLAAVAFLDAFQKVADMATNTRGRTVDGCVRLRLPNVGGLYVRVRMYVCVCVITGTKRHTRISGQGSSSMYGFISGGGLSRERKRAGSPPPSICTEGHLQINAFEDSVLVCYGSVLVLL